MPTLVHAYDAVVQIEPDIVHGDTPHGRRIRVPIVGGTFAGDRLRGTVVPGGADWQLLRADGSLVIEADYFMRTDDGVEVLTPHLPHGLDQATQHELLRELLDDLLDAEMAGLDARRRAERGRGQCLPRHRPGAGAEPADLAGARSAGDYGGRMMSAR